LKTTRRSPGAGIQRAQCSAHRQASSAEHPAGRSGPAIGDADRSCRGCRKLVGPGGSRPANHQRIVEQSAVSRVIASAVPPFSHSRFSRLMSAWLV
jgi:hypothetical protein